MHVRALFPSNYDPHDPVKLRKPKPQRRIASKAETKKAIEAHDYDIVDAAESLRVAACQVLKDAREMGIYFPEKQRVGRGEQKFFFDLDGIVKRRKAGEKVIDIANELGCSETTIYSHFKKAGRSLKDEVEAS